MLSSVGSEADNRTIAIALLGEETGRVQHIDVVVGPRHAKVSMPNPKTVVNDCFKDHRRVGTLIPTGELASPRCRTILPLPVHTINTP